MTKPYFYIPNLNYWKWDRLTHSFIKTQYDKTLEAFTDTEIELGRIDADVEKCRQEIKGEWATGSVQHMRAFNDRLANLRTERKGIERLRVKIRGVLDRLNVELSKEIKV